jgi:hypothetical protein
VDSDVPGSGEEADDDTGTCRRRRRHLKPSPKPQGGKGTRHTLCLASVDAAPLHPQSELLGDSMPKDPR